jgi:hypothetical protein
MTRASRGLRPGTVRDSLPGILIGLAAACLLGNGGDAHDRLNLEIKLTREQLVHNFDTIVFHNEFDSHVDQKLRKWVAPVRIYLDIRTGDPKLIRETVASHVAHLVDISGYDIELTDDPGAANTNVVFERENMLDTVKADYFPPSFDIRTVMQTNLCIGQYQSNAHFEIIKAVVVIPIDRVMARGRLKACVIEELTQVLGLPNDSDDVFPSVFNDHSPDIELTAQDILLVQLLFDSRLTAGMSRYRALELVQAILMEKGIDEFPVISTPEN